MAHCRSGRYCLLRVAQPRVPQMSGGCVCKRGVQFYLFLAGVPVPLLGTEFVQSPEVSALRSIPHFILFAVTFYFGFLRADTQKTNA
jgi:hypothetical protein